MNETKTDNKASAFYNAGVPSIGWMTRTKNMAERLLNNLPLFMFGLLMFVTLAMDIF